MVMSNEHIPTQTTRQRVSDLSTSGIPAYLIAEILDISDDTLRKHYRKELNTAQAVALERVARTVMAQALDGDQKSQALLLKTQGAKFGFVEKQVVETVDSKDTEELKAKISELESKYSSDY